MGREEFLQLVPMTIPLVREMGLWFAQYPKGLGRKVESMFCIAALLPAPLPWLLLLPCPLAPFQHNQLTINKADLVRAADARPLSEC